MPRSGNVSSSRRALWTAPRRPRLPLGREQIVTAALALLDQDGFDGLTMRRLAERLGVKAASLYNHVTNREELLVLMADAICSEVPSSSTGTWREQLEELARILRRVLLAHRDGARVLAATPPIGPHRLRLVEEVLRAFRDGAGLSAARTVDAAVVFNSFLVGFVLDETSGDPTATRRQREEGRRWMKGLPRETYPVLVALADELTESRGEARFELGVRALLDGLAIESTT